MNAMFESATLRLTAIYVILLMAVSAFFSYNWYSVASSELDASFRQQRNALLSGPFRIDNSMLNEYIEHRLNETEAAKHVVFSEIVTANFIFLSIAATGSYLLARKTLQPIEKAHAAQRRFTADASHELRTPIAAMQTEIEVYLRDENLTKEEAKDLLKSNLEELAKLRDLSSNLLLIARQDEDGQLELKPTKSEKISHDALSRVRKLAKNKQITLENTIDKAQVRANQKALSELLVVLLENAIKYSPSETTVTLRGQVKGRHYRYSVEDSGRGIDSDDYERIFERFFRVDQSRNKTVIDGTGLGLAIAKNIASQHGTNIQVKSPGIGKGTTFWVDLEIVGD